MSNLPATRNSQVTITLSDGTTVTVDPRQAMRTVKPPEEAPRYEGLDLWQLYAGRADDFRVKRSLGKLYIYRTVYTDGKPEDQSHVLGAEFTGYVIGFWRQRSAMPAGKYDPKTPKAPVCRAFRWFQPDETIRVTGSDGKPTFKALNGDLIPGTSIVAGPCCTIDENGKEKAVCPLAQFQPLIDSVSGKQARDPQTNKPKWIPPQCRADYLIALALPIETEKGIVWEAAEVHFKVSQERNGQKLIGAINELAETGIALWSIPVVMAWDETYGGIITAEVSQENRVWQDGDLEIITALERKYQALTDIRLAAASESLESRQARKAAAENRAEQPATDTGKSSRVIDTKAELI